MSAIGPRDPYSAVVPEPPPELEPASQPDPAPRAAAARSAALPGWYPPGFDLDRAAAGARALLEAQGEPPASIGHGKANRLVFTDADLTLLNSAPPSVLRHKRTGEVLAHPGTGGELKLGLGPERDARKDLARLKRRYPTVRWADYRLDASAYGSRDEILRTPAIGSTVRTLKASDRNPKGRDFVITARSHGTVPPALDEYLRDRKVDINGVFAVNHVPTAARLGVTKLDSARKKAVTMAAILKLYQPPEARLDRVRFLDDSDKNLVASMQLLPRLYPRTKLEFYDVVHTGGEKFKRVLVARSGRTPGELVDAAGRKLTDAQIAAYRSADAPFPDRSPR